MIEFAVLEHSLPWPYDALEPYISQEIVHFHFDKHHQGYVTRYNNALRSPDNMDIAGLDLEQAMQKLAHEIRGGNASRLKVFQDGGQAWNHDFFWHSMSNESVPSESTAAIISSTFGSMEEFKQAFVSAGKAHFGSGWVWLVKNKLSGVLSICTTKDADAPIFSVESDLDSDPYLPLIVCDLWEHSYYLQYKNDRASYLEAFVQHLIDWNRLEQRLLGAEA